MLFNTQMGNKLKILLLPLILLLSACGSTRQPIPPGVIPEEQDVIAADEQYGHQVLESLTQNYPLDRDDARINRVRDIVDRLTKAAHADRNPWHVYVLQGDNFKNAAATRGNFIFVWTGILNTTQSDEELATILAHEIGHVLAGHTAPDPSEESSRIIAGIAGAATGQIVAQRGLGPVADLAEAIIKASLEALLLNPDQQVKELEADQIGIFMMADAGYNPQGAIDFWQHVQTDPEFSDVPLQFMSSHPSSSDRLERLKSFLSEATERFMLAANMITKPAPAAESNPNPTKSPQKKHRTLETWEVVDHETPVFEAMNTSSKLVSNLALGTNASVKGMRGGWLYVESPVRGYAEGSHFSPK